MLTKTVKKEKKAITSEREQVLYLFRTSGQTPWILRERATAYAGLGADAGPSSFQNFLTTVTRLRERAPQAVYDERLLAPGLASGARAAGSRVRGSATGDVVSTTSAGGIDLLAHVLALWIARGQMHGS